MNEKQTAPKKLAGMAAAYDEINRLLDEGKAEGAQQYQLRLMRDYGLTVLERMGTDLTTHGGPMKLSPPELALAYRDFGINLLVSLFTTLERDFKMPKEVRASLELNTMSDLAEAFEKSDPVEINIKLSEMVK